MNKILILAIAALAFMIAANPTQNQDATTKKYVDTSDNLKVNKSGDNMTGSLFLNSTSSSLPTSFTSIDSGFIVGSQTRNAVIGTRSYSSNQFSFFDQTNDLSHSLLMGTYGSTYLGSWFGTPRADSSFIISYPSHNLTMGSYGNKHVIIGTNNLNYIDLYNNNITITKNITNTQLSGIGNAAVCTDSTGKLFRSTNATSNYLTC